ncbi:MAG: M20 family metallopeptidase [Chloroflexi bacterium]|nr:M20 family metallopeptidase [Chloroflexota bacterium]
MAGRGLVEHLESQQSEMVEALRVLVDHESPSSDKPALDGLARLIAGRFEGLGCGVEVLMNERGGDHVLIRFPAPAGTASERPALVICHYDTVWPLGTLAERPFRVEDGRAYGPGAYDMKASIVLVEYALRAVQSLDLTPRRPVTLLVNSDEEIGSPTSRALIEEQARASAYALVMEPPLASGALKTARKGVGRFGVEIEGRAAHAGVEPEKGISAVVELAYQILRIAGIADPAAGTTINVGVIQGGTRPNVVPAAATARVDVRVTTLAEADRVDRSLRALAPVLPGAKVTITGGFDKPPMERTAEIAALFGRAQTLARDLDLDLQEGATGGASDGNFTAAIGVPTLDGLGVLGGGAHAIDEHVRIESLPVRAGLLTRLLTEL